MTLFSVIQYRMELLRERIACDPLFFMHVKKAAASCAEINQRTYLGDWEAAESYGRSRRKEQKASNAQVDNYN